MGLPTRFKDLTLGQVMQLHELSLDTELDKLDKDIKRLSILMGKTIEQIEEMDAKWFKEYLRITQMVAVPPKDIPVKSKIMVKGRVLYPTLSLQEMKVNQLVDFYSLYKASGNDHLKCANELLAVMYKPFRLGGKPKYDPGNHAKISKLLLSANGEDCMGLLFFYSRLWKKCAPRIQASLERSNDILENLMTEIQTDKEFQDFLKTGDGNTM